MIADIYGKISQSGSNLNERLEDKLTGDIFGTIRYLPAEKLLLPFLRKAYWLDPDTHQRQPLKLQFDSEPELIFWPRKYPGIEPDLEIIGTESSNKVKILIEVKYKSGLSGDDDPSESIIASKSNNQLIKQARALANALDSKRKLLIFLTEDGAYPQQLLDRITNILNSESRLSNIRLYWLSWHDITSVVASLLYSGMPFFDKRITEDILKYCHRKGFRRYEYRLTKRDSLWKFNRQFSRPKSSPPRSVFSTHFLHAYHACKQWSFNYE